MEKLCKAARIRSIASILASILFMMLIFTSASAQAQRTFVSGLGSGTTCSRTAPCRQLATALSQTNPGGEVVVLDSAGYGVISITQAVSITAPPYTGISVFSGDGIDINAGASDTVILRGLTINNQGSTGSGIVFNTGGTLRIEGCVVNGFASTNQAGILFNGPGTLEVKGSATTGNFDGIRVGASSGTARAAIDSVRLEDNANSGVVATDGSIVAVRKSLASGNPYAGFHAHTFGSGGAQLNLEECVASHNGEAGIEARSDSSGPVEINVESCVSSSNTNAGIYAVASSTGTATIRFSNSTVTDNPNGLATFTISGNPAMILSRVNNTIEGNTHDSFMSGGTITTYTAK
jgi:hypothetical protein